MGASSFAVYGHSSIGRVAVSKTVGCRFESCCPCKTHRSKMANVAEYVKDSYTELVERVTWPGPKQLQEASVLVFIASLLIAGIVFAMDWVFGVNAADSVWQGVIGLIYTYVV